MKTFPRLRNKLYKKQAFIKTRFSKFMIVIVVRYCYLLLSIFPILRLAIIWTRLFSKLIDIY